MCPCQAVGVRRLLRSMACLHRGWCGSSRAACSCVLQPPTCVYSASSSDERSCAAQSTSHNSARSFCTATGLRRGTGSWLKMRLVMRGSGQRQRDRRATQVVGQQRTVQGGVSRDQWLRVGMWGTRWKGGAAAGGRAQPALMRAMEFKPTCQQR